MVDKTYEAEGVVNEPILESVEKIGVTVSKKKIKTRKSKRRSQGNTGTNNSEHDSGRVPNAT